MLIDQRFKNVAQFIRNHIDQLLLGDFFDGFVLLRDLRIEIFYRRRQVAGQDFRGIVIHRQQRDAFGVNPPAEFTIFDRRQRMGHHRDL